MMFQLGPYAISYFDVIFLVGIECFFMALFLFIFMKVSKHFLPKLFKKPSKFKTWLVNFISGEDN